MPRETHPEAWNFIAPAGVNQSSTEHSAAALSFPSSALASSSSSSSSSNEAKKEEGKEEDKDKEEEEFRTRRRGAVPVLWHFSGLIGTPILLS